MSLSFPFPNIFPFLSPLWKHIGKKGRGRGMVSLFLIGLLTVVVCYDQSDVLYFLDGTVHSLVSWVLLVIVKMM